jgi:hypothetical protein
MHSSKFESGPSHRLVRALSGPNTPSTVSTAWISQQIGVDWRTRSHRLLARPAVQLALAALGWQYRPRPGRKGGMFVRGADRTPAVEAAVGLPWATISRALLW